MNYNGWENFETWELVTKILNDETEYIFWSKLAKELSKPTLATELEMAYGYSEDVSYNQIAKSLIAMESN